MGGKHQASSGMPMMPGMANKFQGGRIQLSPQPTRALQPPPGLSTATTVSIGKHTVSLDADELELVCELGRGAYGDVHKMREKKTGAELAVKRIRWSSIYLTHSHFPFNTFF